MNHFQLEYNYVKSALEEISSHLSQIESMASFYEKQKQPFPPRLSIERERLWNRREDLLNEMANLNSVNERFPSFYDELSKELSLFGIFFHSL